VDTPDTITPLAWKNSAAFAVSTMSTSTVMARAEGFFLISAKTRTFSAAQVGVTRQTSNSIEKGRFHPNLRLGFKIARSFGKRIAEVFIYDDI
jgi:putative transcriptional regulator